MSFNRLEDSSSSSPNNNNRVEPNFFGSSSLYQQPSKKNDTADSSGTENPHWSNPPPPYSPTTTASDSLQSDQPSAPPLETAPSVYSDPLQRNSNQQQQPYPPVGYGQYGTVNPNNNTISDHIPNWPWIAPPSTTAGQGYVAVPPSPQTNQPYPPYPTYQNHIHVPPKKQKTCCELTLKYIFYFFCICLVIRLIELLSEDGSAYAGFCASGVKWENLPDKFEFGDKGIKIHVAGGHLSGGRIEIKTIDEDDENGFTTGTVTTSALLFPASLNKDPELSFSLTHSLNGTTFEIFIPQHLSTLRSCVSLNAVIHVPKKLVPHVFIEVQNARVIVQDDTLNIGYLSLTTTNSAIEFLPQWSGDTLVLQTTNAHIDVFKSILGCTDIVASTTNAGVRLRNTIEASDLIFVATTNGGIDVDTAVNSKHTVKLTTTNGHVHVQQMKASVAELKSTNGRMQINRAYIDGILNAQTTNGQLKLHVDGSPQPQIIARTTNSNIYTWMPLEYEGTFELTTSRTSNTRLVDDLGWSRLDLLEKGHAIGTRQRLGQHNETLQGSLEVSTTNGDARVTFATPEYY